ncbi:hypothetical protein ACP70R_035903 [Stipagrostis hirtigluma subsp. patula]
MAAAGAALRLRLLYRMLRAGEVLALVAVLSWSSARVPSAAAAVLRLAGSLLLNARFVFVLGNAIVLLLLALSRHDLSSSTSSDEQPATAADSATPPQQAAPAAAATASFTSFATPTAPPAAVEAVSFTTPAVAPPAMEAPEAAPSAHEPVRCAAVVAAFEDRPASSAAAARLSKARAPRRSRSEKLSQRVARRAASPELRRSESENGRASGSGGAARRRSSVTARDAAACWGMDDADEFRRTVEAFIAKQTRFHREESMVLARHCEAAPAIAGALAVVE